LTKIFQILENKEAIESTGIVKIPSTIPAGKLKEIFGLTQQQVEISLKFLMTKYEEAKKEKQDEVLHHILCC